jgi:hypothetical protein
MLAMLAPMLALLLAASAVVALPFANTTASNAALHKRSVAYPLHTSSRWILDANNNRVKLRCANWVRGRLFFRDAELMIGPGWTHGGQHSGGLVTPDAGVYRGLAC